MKKVFVPSSANPFVVYVNGMNYTYPAGTIQEVPDDVALIIERYQEDRNKEPDPVNPPFDCCGCETGGGSGVSVQADWEQTDETAADFIKNKPFGDLPTTLYEATDLSLTESDGAFILEVSVNFGLTAGQQYTTTIDGSKYISECMNYVDIYLVLGNLAFIGMGDDNGLPFTLILADSTMQFICMQDFDTLVISTMEPQQIDSKYIKTGVVYVDGNYLFKSPNVTNPENKLTKSELEELVKSCSSLFVSNKGSYHSVIHLYFKDNYAEVQTLITTTAEFKFDKYYTAEYEEGIAV